MMATPILAVDDYYYPENVFNVGEVFVWKHSRVYSFENGSIMEYNVTYTDYERGITYNLSFSSLQIVKEIGGKKSSDVGFDAFQGMHYDENGNTYENFNVTYPVPTLDSMGNNYFELRVENEGTEISNPYGHGTQLIENGTYIRYFEGTNPSYITIERINIVTGIYLYIEYKEIFEGYNVSLVQTLHNSTIKNLPASNFDLTSETNSNVASFLPSFSLALIFVMVSQRKRRK